MKETAISFIAYTGAVGNKALVDGKINRAAKLFWVTFTDLSARLYSVSALISICLHLMLFVLIFCPMAHSENHFLVSENGPIPKSSVDLDELTKPFAEYIEYTTLPRR